MTTNKNNGFKVNFTTKTLTITKAFEEDLMNGDANAMAVVTRFQSMFPDLTIVRKTHRSPKTTNPDKGLTYERMERYISLHENSDELLEMFQKVKAIASTQKNSFLYTKRWFMKQFPHFTELPTFTNGKLYVLPVNAPEVEEVTETEEKKVVNF